MIKGIGVDIVKISRFKEVDDYFIKRIFSKEEQLILCGLDLSLRTSYMAKRFAVKEALFKALKSTVKIEFNTISVLNHPDGSPYIKEMPNVEISISDEDEYAIAFVIVMTTEKSL